jgi:hypothetical protein
MKSEAKTALSLDLQPGQCERHASAHCMQCWQGMKDSNPQISLWRRAVCAISLIPRKTGSQFSKTNKKPRPESGSGARGKCALRPSRHNSPNDPLAGHSGYVVFEGSKHCVDWLLTSSYNYNATYGASGRIRTCVRGPRGRVFVRGVEYTSFVAKAIHPLWHGRSLVWSGWTDLNRRPLAPKASALPDCATPGQIWPSQLVAASGIEPDSLAFQTSAFT